MEGVIGFPAKAADFMCPSCMTFEKVIIEKANNQLHTTIRCSRCHSTIADFQFDDPRQLVLPL